MKAKFSVLIPVYNEKKYFPILLSRVILAQIPGGLIKEIVIVDDASTDGTRDFVYALEVSPFSILQPYLEKQLSTESSCAELRALVEACEFKIIFQARNQGKGAAIQRAIDASTGDYVIIQDADLEYDPKDYAKLLAPMLDDNADVVYGSRFKGECAKVLYYKHYLGNKFLTTLSNWFTDLNFTDMEACYKLFKGPLIRNIYLTSNRFGFEPEVTARIAKAKLSIFEVPISYHGRTYEQGKKITWKDGIAALWFILKFNLFSSMVYRDATKAVESFETESI